MPQLGHKTVDSITTADVMAVLVPIWNTRRETARRVRQRIGAVMKWSVAHLRDNPAGDAIAEALPKDGMAYLRRSTTGRCRMQVGAAVEQIPASGAYRAILLAFEFLVLTASPSGEVRGARWEEIDFGSATWTVARLPSEDVTPASRAAFQPCRGNSRGSARTVRRCRPGISVADGPQAERHHNLQAGAGERHRLRPTRDEELLPGLGRLFAPSLDLNVSGSVHARPACQAGSRGLHRARYRRLPKRPSSPLAPSPNGRPHSFPRILSLNHHCPIIVFSVWDRASSTGRQKSNR